MVRHQVGLTLDELAHYQARLAKIVGPVLGIPEPPHLPAVIRHARGLPDGILCLEFAIRDAARSPIPDPSIEVN